MLIKGLSDNGYDSNKTGQVVFFHRMPHRPQEILIGEAPSPEQEKIPKVQGGKVTFVTVNRHTHFSPRKSDVAGYLKVCDRSLVPLSIR
jgi:hypothetical protein